MALSSAGDLLSCASDQVLNNSIADQLNILTNQLFNISSDQPLSVVHRICRSLYIVNNQITNSWPCQYQQVWS